MAQNKDFQSLRTLGRDSKITTTQNSQQIFFIIQRNCSGEWGVGSQMNNDLYHLPSERPMKDLQRGKGRGKWCNLHYDLNRREIIIKRTSIRLIVGPLATEPQLEKLVYELTDTEWLELWVSVINQRLLRLSGNGRRRNGIASTSFVMTIFPIITSAPMEMPYHTRARGRVCVIEIRC